MQAAGESRGPRDRKQYLWVLGLIAPGCALLPSQLVLRTGSEVFWWIGPIIVLIVIPILDLIVGEDGSNPRDEDYEALSNNHYYRWCTYMFLPIQLLGLVIASSMWGLRRIEFHRQARLGGDAGVRQRDRHQRGA